MIEAKNEVAGLAQLVKFPDELIARFWAKVDKNGPVVRPDLGPCWIWKGAGYPNGYGSFRLGKDMRSAHRCAYIICRGSIPDGMCICHTCDQKGCVNPSHLWAGTNHDNSLDMCRKGRQAKGERSGKYTHPESTRRGDNHPARLHPETRPRGENHANSKLNNTVVIEARRRFATGQFSISELAAWSGVSTVSIRKAIRGETWAHVTMT